jgi:acyl carrier protein
MHQHPFLHSEDRAPGERGEATALRQIRNVGGSPDDPETAAIEKNVREFLVENFPLGGEWSSISAADSLLEVGVIDSTGVLELVDFIESSYRLTVPVEDLLSENLDSIEAITRYVAGKLANGNAPSD